MRIRRYLFIWVRNIPNPNHPKKALYCINKEKARVEINANTIKNIHSLITRSGAISGGESIFATGAVLLHDIIHRCASRVFFSAARSFFAGIHQGGGSSSVGYCDVLSRAEESAWLSLLA